MGFSKSIFMEEHGDAFTCTISFDAFERPVTTSCGHTFCEKCLTVWTLGHFGSTTCPMCRENLEGEIRKKLEGNISAEFFFVIDRPVERMTGELHVRCPNKPEGPERPSQRRILDEEGTSEGDFCT
jgi:hypothetical protein